MTPYQLKSARFMLRLTQQQLADKLGRPHCAVLRAEKGHAQRTTEMELAIRWLLCEAGLYAHFRMLFMRKKKMVSVDPDYKKVFRSQQCDVLIEDALSFKYDK